MTRLLTFASLVTVIACGDKADITADMVGTYSGSIADPVVSDSYTVSVAAVDGDTISISGADFTTFEVDVMAVGTLITQDVSVTDTTLSFEDGSLDFTHEGVENVTFSGEQGEASSDSTGTEDTDTTGEDTDTTETTEDTPADMASGNYLGMISGPVIDTDYTITLTVIDADTVEVSGADFDSFEIPLVMNGSEIEQATNWSEGSFVWDAGSLDLVYNPIGLTFSGEQN